MTTKTKTIYVELLDEGVQVWRPVRALQVEGDVFVILRSDDAPTDVEDWAFPPGSTVHCETDDNGRLRANRAAELAVA